MENYIQKIQKLFNLANKKDGNETEAAAALAMAQKLCAKHNLDLATIQDSPMATGNTMVEEKREKTKVNRSAMYMWQRNLWKALAEANFCFHWITEISEAYNKRYSWGMEQCHRRVKRHVILGRESNTIVVRLMGEYICDTIERMCGEQWPNRERLSREAISWRTGIADRLIERIEEQSAKMRNAKTQDTFHNSTALVLVDVDSREYEANYDAKYGQGAYRRHKEAEERWDKEYQERQERLQREHVEMLQNETPEQKRQREDEEEQERIKAEREWIRNQARFRAQREREAAKLDWGAYSRGQKAGDSINLDPQVGAGKAQEQLR